MDLHNEVAVLERMYVYDFPYVVHIFHG